MFFHQIFVNIYNITDINSLTTKGKLYINLLSSAFLHAVIMLMSLEIFHKHIEYVFISEFFVLN